MLQMSSTPLPQKLSSKSFVQLEANCFNFPPLFNPLKNEVPFFFSHRYHLGGLLVIHPLEGTHQGDLLIGHLLVCLLVFFLPPFIAAYEMA
jgi:hypothetical protein